MLVKFLFLYVLKFQSLAYSVFYRYSFGIKNLCITAIYCDMYISWGQMIRYTHFIEPDGGVRL